MRRLSEFLISYRAIILSVAVVLTALAWPVARKLTFERSIDSLYAVDDPHLTDYLDSKRWFGGDEFAFIAYADPELFDEDGKLNEKSAAKIDALARQLSDVPGIQKESTQHLAQALSFPYGKQRIRKLAEGMLVGEDGETTAVVLRFAPMSDSGLAREETIRQLRTIASEHNPPCYVVGEPIQVLDMFRYVEEDGHVLFAVSLVLLGAVIFILFGNPRWVILPLAVVIASIFWTEALLVLSRLRLSMVSSMLNSLVTIIGVATVTHVTVHYREQRLSKERREALRETFIELGSAIFWTCATTAIGFAALLSSRITPVRSFGMMVALGTLLVLVAAATILPGGILLGKRLPDPGRAPAEGWLAHLLETITHWVEHHPRTLMISTVAFTLFAAAGFFRLEVETDFSKNFRSSSPIVQSLAFVEGRLGGAGTWEVNFAAPSELSDEYLDHVRHLEDRLRNELLDKKGSTLTKVTGMTDGLDLVPKIPFVLNTLEKRLAVLNAFQNEFASSLYNSEEGRMRIVLRALERQSAESKSQLISSVQSIAREEFPDAKVTGLFVLLTFLIESLLRDQWVSFVLAATGIFLMMTIAFRNVWIGMISLVPNLFPIVVVIGTMGWIGLPINIATAMIASVSMGLTVDSSIHYISGFRRAQARGASTLEALRETHSGVGRALVFANVALIIGFSVLTLSHFIPLVYFGILVSVAMFGGLIGNLVLLPMLLQWVFGKDNETAATASTVAAS